MSNTKVHIYVFEGCPYCINALSLLEEKGITFEKTVVNRGDSKTREELKARSGMNTFPQIFHNDKIIGGFSELSALNKEKGLEHLK
jgi:glutaredoxin 3